MGKLGESWASRPHSRRTAAWKPSSGLTLIEVMVGFAVLVVGLLGFVRVLVGSMAASATTHEVAIAKEAARGALETLAAADFTEIFRLYNDEPADDPGGNGTAPGKDFAVAGLDPRTADADGLVGEILFPAEAGAPGVLREDLVDVRFGTPRDLNGDAGAIDANDHSGDYQILPVVVRVAWRGTSGNSQAEFKTLLANY